MSYDQMNSPSFNVDGKDSGNIIQLKLVYYYLKDNTATASMVTKATGVTQKNICRYKRTLERAGRLWEVEKKRCRHTGCKAWYLTTNENKAPMNNQLRLF
jgi:hypothetical protein